MSPAGVECYSGQVYAERPRAIWQAGARLEIKTIETQWRSPQGRHFRVRTTDEQVFELCYSESLDQWQITLLQSTRPGDYAES